TRFGQQGLEFVEPGHCVIPALKTSGALKPRDERIERAVAMLERAEMAQPDMRLVAQALLKRGDQAGLSDPRLARQEHHLPFTGLCARPASEKQFTFFFPPDQRGQAA